MDSAIAASQSDNPKIILIGHRSLTNSALFYLDSLKTEMDKLDEMDVHNVELVKSPFLYKSVGVSIIN